MYILVVRFVCAVLVLIVTSAVFASTAMAASYGAKCISAALRAVYHCSARPMVSGTSLGPNPATPGIIKGDLSGLHAKVLDCEISDQRSYHDRRELFTRDFQQPGKELRHEHSTNNVAGF